MTEFSFVLVFVIKPFYSIMSPFAFLFLGTLLSLCKFTEFRCIEVVVPSLVLNCVIVVTTFVVMGFILMRTENPFEVS